MFCFVAFFRFKHIAKLCKWLPLLSYKSASYSQIFEFSQIFEASLFYHADQIKRNVPASYEENKIILIGKPKQTLFFFSCTCFLYSDNLLPPPMRYGIGDRSINAVSIFKLPNIPPFQVKQSLKYASMFFNFDTISKHTKFNSIKSIEAMEVFKDKTWLFAPIIML